jgi:Uma2 family endonuclease
MTLATDTPRTLPAKEDPQSPHEAKALPKLVSFDEFMEWYPEKSEFRYELRRGVIIQMPKPRGEHSEIAGESSKKLNYAIDAMKLPYFIPKECVIKRSDNTGYEPDVVVLDRSATAAEPRWKKESAIENGSSIKLVIEVVSTNWQDDYETKMTDYEALGIPEYWIIDYAGLGGTRHIGKPKQPTLTICTIVNGEYENTQFRGDEIIISPTFPELNLTAAQVLGAESVSIED